MSRVPHTSLRAKACAAYNLLVNLSGLVGYTGGHVLGNFSVTKQRGEVGTGFSAKLKDLLQGIADYQVVVESGGRVIPGGHQQFMMAAKGLFDSEVATGRTWVVTGMGANAASGEMWSSTQCFFAREACRGCKTLPWLGGGRRRASQCRRGPSRLVRMVLVESP
jgi:hypothetical protein